VEGWPVVVGESADVLVGSCGDVGQSEQAHQQRSVSLTAARLGGRRLRKKKKRSSSKATTRTKPKAARRKLTIGVSVGVITTPEMARGRCAIGIELEGAEESGER
jgi:sRNA-binding protein